METGQSNHQCWIHHRCWITRGSGTSSNSLGLANFFPSSRLISIVVLVAAAVLVTMAFEGARCGWPAMSEVDNLWLMVNNLVDPLHLVDQLHKLASLGYMMVQHCSIRWNNNGWYPQPVLAGLKETRPKHTNQQPKEQVNKEAEKEASEQGSKLH